MNSNSNQEFPAVIMADPVKRHMNRMLGKHCFCEGVENRILLECISLCQSCESLYTTLIYQIPKEHLKEILSKIDSVMAEYGIPPHGPTPSVTLRQKSLPEGTETDVPPPGKRKKGAKKQPQMQR